MPKLILSWLISKRKFKISSSLTVKPTLLFTIAIKVRVRFLLVLNAPSIKAVFVCKLVLLRNSSLKAINNQYLLSILNKDVIAVDKIEFDLKRPHPEQNLDIKVSLPKTGDLYSTIMMNLKVLTKKKTGKYLVKIDD